MARGDVLEQLVKEWHKNKTPENLEAVVKEATGYVEGISSRVVNTVPNLLGREDLIQYGLIALIACLKRYDPTKKVPFRTMCFPRVKGAMQDAVRQFSPTSRTRNMNVVSYETIQYSLEANLATDGHRDDSVFVGMDGKLVSKQLVKALAGLTIRQQVVILLSLNGLKSAHLSNILDISVTAVRHERQTAITKLAETLAAETTDTISEILRNGNST